MDDLCAMPRGQEWLHTRVTRWFRRTHWAFRVDIKLMVGVSKKIDEGYTYIIRRSNLCSGWVPLFSVLFCSARSRKGERAGPISAITRIT